MSGPRIPHPHAEVIHAWADGDAIEVRNCDGMWVPVPPCAALVFSQSTGFRVKPKPHHYRVALIGGITLTADTETQAENIARRSDFNRWLGDWQEVDL